MTLVFFGLLALQGGPVVRLVSLLGLGVRIQRTLFFRSHHHTKRMVKYPYKLFCIASKLT
jgi:hypothetical protein